ncbi:hypothetical protein EGR_07636 [Echinococcus granulosus]|uniref:Uncharacterized protein n=1 Tax=Echinococcus granulosus TaxID=6210 RepID=W6U964_ECHGR|nr:hypothetical protein EGR_07636 [Echinococcus granulosus]EUB57545.1 hypothetical protein EGR_07636 [Echinococcus granulosus]
MAFTHSSVPGTTRSHLFISSTNNVSPLYRRHHRQPEKFSSTIGQDTFIRSNYKEMKSTHFLTAALAVLLAVNANATPTGHREVANGPPHMSSKIGLMLQLGGGEDDGRTHEYDDTGERHACVEDFKNDGHEHEIDHEEKFSSQWDCQPSPSSLSSGSCFISPSSFTPTSTSSSAAPSQSQSSQLFSCLQYHYRKWKEPTISSYLALNSMLPESHLIINPTGVKFHLPFRTLSRCCLAVSASGLPPIHGRLRLNDGRVHLFPTLDGLVCAFPVVRTVIGVILVFFYLFLLPTTARCLSTFRVTIADE